MTKNVAEFGVAAPTHEYFFEKLVPHCASCLFQFA